MPTIKQWNIGSASSGPVEKLVAYPPTLSPWGSIIGASSNSNSSPTEFYCGFHSGGTYRTYKIPNGGTSWTLMREIPSVGYSNLTPVYGYPVSDGGMQVMFHDTNVTTAYNLEFWAYRNMGSESLPDFRWNFERDAATTSAHPSVSALDRFGHSVTTHPYADIYQYESDGYVRRYYGTSTGWHYQSVSNTSIDQTTYGIKDVYGNHNLTLIASINDAPSAPGSFVTPTSTSKWEAGKSYTVDWGDATDPEGNSLTYYLSFYNGSSWSSEVTSTSSSRGYGIPSGLSTTSARFRVRAYDGKLFGNYTYSNYFEVYSNSAPSTPTWVSPGSGTILKGGESVLLDWSDSTDADGDAVTYTIKACYNPDVNSSWTTLYSNTPNSYYSYTTPTDTTYTSVKYGVTASDSKTTSYAESPVFTLEHNATPTLSATTGAGTAITLNQKFLKSDTNDFSFSFIPSDSDSADTIQTYWDLNSTVKQNYTSATSGTSYSHTVAYSELILGNNPVNIKVKDNNGTESTFTFTIRNKIPKTFSQQTTLSALKALGYANTAFTSLSDLKPSGYAGPLSMKDIIDYLS